MLVAGWLDEQHSSVLSPFTAASGSQVEAADVLLHSLDGAWEQHTCVGWL
jgi:hypothetical protein